MQWLLETGFDDRQQPGRDRQLLLRTVSDYSGLLLETDSDYYIESDSDHSGLV